MGYADKYYALRGDPGFFDKAFKGIKGVVKSVSKIPGVGPILTKVAPKLIPGVGFVSTALTVGGLVKKGVGAVKAGGGLSQMYSAARAAKTVGSSGAAARSLALAGGAGALGGAGLSLIDNPLAGTGEGRWATTRAGRAAFGGRRYRRMNPLNPRAARRAIRRIKAVRKMVRSIESQLPKRAAPRGAAPFRRRRRA